ncbi:MAG: hypothetical protein AAF928_04690 [Myxococcota bacterium]
MKPAGLGAAIVFAAGLALSACGATADPSAGLPGSIGAVLDRDPVTGAVYVYETPATTPSPLAPGDRLKMVEGVHVDDLERDELQARLRGPVGSAVRLTVLRGDEVVYLRVVRSPFVGGDGQRERIE